MPIEVPDTRGRGEPQPRRRASRRPAVPPAEPPAEPTVERTVEPTLQAPAGVLTAVPVEVPVEVAAAAGNEPAAVAPAVAAPAPARSVFGKAAPRRRAKPDPPADRADPTPATGSPVPVPDAPAAVAVAVAPAAEAAVSAVETVAGAPAAEPAEAAVPVPVPAPAPPTVAAAPAPPAAVTVEPAAPVPDPRPAEAARAPAERAEPAEMQTVVVRLGGTRYALPMDAVAEVGRPPRVTRVPGLPAWVAGVVNWRGRVLAVLDLRPLLAAAQVPIPVSGRVAVLSRSGVTVGLLTERVEGVVPLDPGRLEPAPLTLPASAATLVAGAVTDPGGPLVLLDLDAVFGLRDRLPRPRRAG